MADAGASASAVAMGLSWKDPPSLAVDGVDLRQYLGLLTERVSTVEDKPVKPQWAEALEKELHTKLGSQEADVHVLGTDIATVASDVKQVWRASRVQAPHECASNAFCARDRCKKRCFGATTASCTLVSPPLKR